MTWSFVLAVALVVGVALIGLTALAALVQLLVRAGPARTAPRTTRS